MRPDQYINDVVTRKNGKSDEFRLFEKVNLTFHGKFRVTRTTCALVNGVISGSVTKLAGPNIKECIVFM